SAALGMERELPRILRRKANILASGATVLLVSALGLSTWVQFTNTRQARLWVHHTNEVINATDELSIAVRDAETAQRGYLLTGREDYLTPYREALGRVALLQGELLRLTADNRSQQERLRA